MSAQGARKIDFKAFRKAVEEIAKAKKADKGAIEQQIIASVPQKSNTTSAGRVRLHDDKDSYTGMSLSFMHWWGWEYILAKDKSHCFKLKLLTHPLDGHTQKPPLYKQNR